MIFPRSSAPGIRWPALPAPPGAAALAMQFQLERSQWWPEDRLRQQQYQQLQPLLAHAYHTVPFYRERLQAVGYDPRHTITPELFSRIPLLRRSDLQQHSDKLISSKLPPEHGNLSSGSTSGSTGRAVTYYGSNLTAFFWCALTLREHLWHKRDFSARLAVIKAGMEDTRMQGWGPATDVVFDTGTCLTLDIRTDIDAQAAWLQRHDPEYLLTHPSNAQALAETFLSRGIRLGKLREVRTMGENVGPKLQEACQAAWGVKVVDMYSAAEVGYLALQCPEHGQYHIQAESVLLEVLNDQSQPCTPGETGRVVVTTLHNFAMPLIRYEILDYAELGEPCPCGRGLPVISRILGRERNLVTYPDGRRHWPRIGYKHWQGVLPIVQSQLVQHSLEEIEARLVTSRPLSANEETQLTSILHTSLGYPFRIAFSYHSEIPRSAGGKFEDFMSEVGKASH